MKNALVNYLLKFIIAENLFTNKARWVLPIRKQNTTTNIISCRSHRFEEVWHWYLKFTLNEYVHGIRKALLYLCLGLRVSLLKALSCQFSANSIIDIPMKPGTEMKTTDIHCIYEILQVIAVAIDRNKPSLTFWQIDDPRLFRERFRSNIHVYKQPETWRTHV